MKRTTTLLYAIIFISALMLFAVPPYDHPHASTYGLLMPDFDYSLDSLMSYTKYIGIVRIVENHYVYKNHECVKAQLIESLYGELPQDIYFIEEFNSRALEGREYVAFMNDGYPKGQGFHDLAFTDSLYEISLTGKLVSRAEIGDAALETILTLDALREYLKGAK